MMRQKMTLCSLAVILTGSIVYGVARYPVERRVASLTYLTGMSAQSSRKPEVPGKDAAETVEVQVSLLERIPPRFEGCRRNLFSPIFRDGFRGDRLSVRALEGNAKHGGADTYVLPPALPLPPPPSLTPYPVPATTPLPLPPLSQPLPQPSAEELAVSDMAKITFRGFVKKEGAKTVFLAKNGKTFLAKKGSVIAEKYLVDELTDESISIRAVNGGGRIVIPLVENKPLATH